MRTIKNISYRGQKQTSEKSIANKVPWYLDQGAAKKWQGDIFGKNALYKELKDSVEQMKTQEYIIKTILNNQYGDIK